jgi:hypothetical protein
MINLTASHSGFRNTQISESELGLGLGLELDLGLELWLELWLGLESG